MITDLMIFDILKKRKNKYQRLIDLFKINAPEMIAEIEMQVPFGKNFSEKIYVIINNLQSPPKCCICGATVDFENFIVGYNKTCSSKCASVEPSRKKKIADTNMKRYGSASPQGSAAVRKKTESTLLSRYGVTNAGKLVNTKVLFKERFADILMSDPHRCGNCTPMFSKEDYVRDGKRGKYPFKCKECGHEFITYLINGHIPECPHCKDPTWRSQLEDVIASKIKEKYAGKIIINDRRALGGMEIDIWIPEKNVGIEINGDYFHSDLFKTKTYHLEKTELARRMGIRLIHAFEHELKDLKKFKKFMNKIMRMILPSSRKLNARKCSTARISPSVARTFLDKYHLQGADNSSIRIGLFSKNHLVALMTFCRPRFTKGYEWELSRFVTVSNFSVRGAAGKLLKEFERSISPNSLISYANLRWSDGDVYKKLGFSLIKTSPPNYVWVKGKTIISRYATQKHKLAKLLGDKFDASKTEEENMRDLNFYKLYDCGNLVFEKKYQY